MRLLLLSAAAAVIAFPALAQVGAMVPAPILPSGAGPVAGDNGVSAGASMRDPVAAATDMTSPTSRSSQAAARASKRQADEAAAAATNSSATVGIMGAIDGRATAPLGVPTATGGVTATGGPPLPSTDATGAAYPSTGGGVVTPTP